MMLITFFACLFVCVFLFIRCAFLKAQISDLKQLTTKIENEKEELRAKYTNKQLEETNTNIKLVEKNNAVVKAQNIAIDVMHVADDGISILEEEIVQLQLLKTTVNNLISALKEKDDSCPAVQTSMRSTRKCSDIFPPYFELNDRALSSMTPKTSEKSNDVSNR